MFMLSKNVRSSKFQKTSPSFKNCSQIKKCLCFPKSLSFSFKNVHKFENVRVLIFFLEINRVSNFKTCFRSVVVTHVISPHRRDRSPAGGSRFDPYRAHNFFLGFSHWFEWHAAWLAQSTRPYVPHCCWTQRAAYRRSRHWDLKQKKAIGASMVNLHGSCFTRLIL